MTKARGAPPVQLAAGGLVWRLDDGEPKLAIVHRPPDRDDWVLPKGGVEEGEALETAAVREVREETAVDAEITGFADTIHFEHDKALEIVAFWHMRVVTVHEFTPNAEIDELDWVTAAEAAARLTHDRERELVSALVGSPRSGRGSSRRWRLSLDPSADRLTTVLPVIELEAGARKAPAMTARQALVEAAAASDRGEAQLGWLLVKLADRLQILEADDDEVEAREVALAKESGEKLSSWRKATVDALLAQVVAKAPGEPPADDAPSRQRRRLLLYEATRIRDEAADNAYRRLALIRRNRTLLLPVMLLVLATLVIGIALGIELDADGEERGAAFVFAVALLGALGASISAMQSIARGAGERMPEALTSATMTLARPAVGAAAAVGAYVIAEAGFPKLDTSSGYVLLALGFAAGFSERFIVGLVESATKKP
jgi:8-oxo-dGTP diphosphatase